MQPFHKRKDLSSPFFSYPPMATPHTIKTSRKPNDHPNHLDGEYEIMERLRKR